MLDNGEDSRKKYGNILFHLGAIIVKWAKNHVKQLKNYQCCQKYFFNATLMSC
jgi:hypothetical protein